MTGGGEPRGVVLFEAADRVGGRMRTEPRGDCWLNLGADLIAGPGSLMYRLTEDAGIEARVAPESATAIHMTQSRAEDPPDAARIQGG